MKALRAIVTGVLLALALGGPGVGAEWHVPLDFSNWSKPQIACKRFKTALEATAAVAWNALDIVQSVPPVQPDLAQAELERLGGSRLVLEVDGDALRKEMLQQARDDVRRVVRDRRLGSPAAAIIHGDAIEFQPRDSTDAASVQRAFGALLSGPNAPLVSRHVDEEHAARGGVAFALSDQAFEERRRSSQQISAEVMERRLREAGVAAGLVQPQDDGRILVIAPSLNEFERLFRLLESRAKLTFRMVDGSADPCAVAATPPADSEVLRHYASKAVLLVERRVAVSGEDIAAVTVVRQAGAPAVAFRLNVNGASRLAQALRESAIGESAVPAFAIVLDNEVIAAPAVRGSIADGTVLLSGGLSPQQAKEIAMLMRAAFTPAPLAIVERQIVEPKPR